MMRRQSLIAFIAWVLAAATTVSSECSRDGFCSDPLATTSTTTPPQSASNNRAITCPASDCDATPMGILEHHLDLSPGNDDGGSVACLDGNDNTEQNAYLRCFAGTLCSEPKQIDSVFFRVGRIRDTFPGNSISVLVTVNLYKGATANGCSSLTGVRAIHAQAPVATETIILSEGEDIEVTVVLTEPVPLDPSESLLVEISVPSLVSNQGAFFLADNDNADQCDTSYLQTDDCGDTDLVVAIPTIEPPRFATVSHVITVNVSPAAPSSAPSSLPSTSPSTTPTDAPSVSPSAAPSSGPSHSSAPSSAPTDTPPSPQPSSAPSAAPTSAAPSVEPSPAPQPPVPPAGSPVPAPPAFCLSGGMLVRVLGRDAACRLRDVQVGDWIATAVDGIYSRVVSLGHYDPDVVTTFLQIFTTATDDEPLEITSDHYMFVNTTATVVPASQVQVGDVLPPSMARVTAIRTVQRRGAYAPITEAGELLVNGIRVSSYVQVWNDAWMIQQHPQVWAHLLFSPLRMFCRWQPDVCAAETHSSLTGFSNLYGGMIEWLIWIGQWGPVVSGALAMAALPLLVCLWGLEQVSLMVLTTKDDGFGIRTVLLIVAFSTMMMVWMHCTRTQKASSRGARLRRWLKDNRLVASLGHTR